MRRSIRRATTVVTSRTTPTTISRCQNGMALYSTAASPSFARLDQLNPSPRRLKRPVIGSRHSSRLLNAGNASARVAKLPRRRQGSRRRARRPSKRQRLPPAESLVDSVPVANLVLAELPAEQDNLVAAFGGKVQQPFLERLHLRACGIDALCALGDRRGFALDRIGSLVQVARNHVAAVSGDTRDELRLLNLRCAEIASMLNHPLDDRPQLDKGRVGFLRREGTGHSTV